MPPSDLLFAYPSLRGAGQWGGVLSLTPALESGLKGQLLFVFPTIGANTPWAPQACLHITPTSSPLGFSLYGVPLELPSQSVNMYMCEARFGVPHESDNVFKESHLPQKWDTSPQGLLRRRRWAQPTSPS